MTDKIDRLIETYFRTRPTLVSGQRGEGAYPSSETLVRYLEDGLEGRELERMLEFIRNDAAAQELVARAREILESESGWEDEKVPAELLRRAKNLRPAGRAAACPHCGKPITPFKKAPRSQRWANALWLALGLASFALSFVVHRFFYQCLAAALLFGFKWIVEQRAAKTQIMIYKALSDDSGSERHRLHQHSSRL